MQVENSINQMSLNDKLFLMEELWNSISTHSTPPMWHKDILDERAKELKSRDIKSYSIEELESIGFNMHTITN